MINKISSAYLLFGAYFTLAAIIGLLVGYTGFFLTNIGVGAASLFLGFQLRKQGK